MQEPAEALHAGAVSLRLLLVFLLVIANGFFVAAEFALVGARRSKIDHLAAGGDARARTVQRALAHLDRHLSGTQLGITISSLALGAVGEPAVAALFDSLFAKLGFAAPAGASHTAAAVTVAFLVIIFLHIVLGELAPKSMAIAMPEVVSRWVARPLMLFSRVMGPFIWLLNGAANALLRLFRISPVSELSHIHSADELRLLVRQAHEHGTLDAAETAIITGAFEFHEKRARDVMRPRTEVVGLPIEATERDVRAVVRREQYSRYPVYRNTLDDIQGVFVVKDLLVHEEGAPFTVGQHVRPVLYVPDSRPAEKVLDDLRRSRSQMAVALDEFGGTAGILTVEDLVEEVVGDIADEYDQAARNAVDSDGVLELAGSLSLVDVRSDYQVAIPEGSWTTLGGFVFAQLGRVPKIGDRVPSPGGELEVVAMDGRRVAAVRVHRRSHE